MKDSWLTCHWEESPHQVWLYQSREEIWSQSSSDNNASWKCRLVRVLFQFDLQLATTDEQSHIDCACTIFYLTVAPCPFLWRFSYLISSLLHWKSVSHTRRISTEQFDSHVQGILPPLFLISQRLCLYMFCLFPLVSPWYYLYSKILHTRPEFDPVSCLSRMKISRFSSLLEGKDVRDESTGNLINWIVMSVNTPCLLKRTLGDEISARHNLSLEAKGSKY